MSHRLAARSGDSAAAELKSARKNFKPVEVIIPE
jgi:hypothetical protein